jgi:hypothetical protein
VGVHNGSLFIGGQVWIARKAERDWDELESGQVRGRWVLKDSGNQQAIVLFYYFITILLSMGFCLD